MHLSPEFTQDSALAAAVGGMGLGAVATVFAHTNKRLLPSATPDAEVWTGMAAGAFALVFAPFFLGGAAVGAGRNAWATKRMGEITPIPRIAGSTA